MSKPKCYRCGDNANFRYSRKADPEGKWQAVEAKDYCHECYSIDYGNQTDEGYDSEQIKEMALEILKEHQAKKALQ